MIDLQALPLPIYLVVFLLTWPCILAYKLIVWRLLAQPPPASPNISPTSYTPLPSTLITPLLAVPYKHHILTTPNSRVHYITTSPPASSSADTLLPPVLFVHGFPDWWYVWRHQIVHFTPLCRQCVAIDMRGYGYTEVAGDKSDASKYTFIQQCSDILAVLDELKIERVVLCGFDWGGMVVWDVARRYPSRILGVASLGVPYRPRKQWRLPVPTMLRIAPYFLYQVYFAYCPLQAARELGSDVTRSLTLIARSTRPEDDIGMFKKLTAMTGLSLLPFSARRSVMLSGDELRAMVDMYQWSGFRYGLLWYSNLQRNSRQAMKTCAQLGLPSASPNTQSAVLAERIAVPALMMLAERDVILQPVLAEGMDGWCDQLTTVMIRGGGHWAQIEEAEQVNNAIKEWLTSKAVQHAMKDVGGTKR